MFDLKKPKLRALALIEGYVDPIEFLEDYAHDSIVPAICSNSGCDATGDMEPDQDSGFCEHCDTQTMQSGLILAGII